MFLRLDESPGLLASRLMAGEDLPLGQPHATGMGNEEDDDVYHGR